MLRLQFVYVVAGELGFVKIGICQPPDMPGDAARGHSIRPVEILWVAATNGDAHQIEIDAHRSLGASRRTDEWLAIPPEDAIRAVERAAKDLELQLLSVGPNNAYALPIRRIGLVGLVAIGLRKNRAARFVLLIALLAALGMVGFLAYPKLQPLFARLF